MRSKRPITREGQTTRKTAVTPSHGILGGSTGIVGGIKDCKELIFFAGRLVSSKKLIFITYKPKWAGGAEVPKRMRLGTVIRNGWQHRIIACYLCGQPAVQVDCFWPCLNDYTLCAEHIPFMSWHSKGWRTKGRYV